MTLAMVSEWSCNLFEGCLRDYFCPTVQAI
jgi:hypothetical protein